MQAVGGYENDEEGSIGHRSKGEESDRSQDSTTLDHRNPKNCVPSPLSSPPPLPFVPPPAFSALFFASSSDRLRLPPFLCSSHHFAFLAFNSTLGLHCAFPRIGEKEKAIRFRFGIREMSGKLRVGFDSQTSSKVIVHHFHFLCVPLEVLQPFCVEDELSLRIGFFPNFTLGIARHWVKVSDSTDWLV
ncbi:hypothetical protein B296_00041779 [Ensete ventricosum]|uniref:Uncharacterized protein n=1 Tax=Ensete ventricosum TaxID=4639 RepID=A0A426ZKK1_ENSVE|nr:hypothetical protein B296_00041779 [Ensete ventricosum]